jgi:deoxyhypusine synthase
MITSAAKAGVPIFCPALGDSVYGTAFAAAKVKHNSKFLLDVAQDVVDMVKLVAFSAPKTGVIFIGGGTPKNFTQQAGLCTYLFDKEFAYVGNEFSGPYFNCLSLCQRRGFVNQNYFSQKSRKKNNPNWKLSERIPKKERREMTGIVMLLCPFTLEHTLINDEQSEIIAKVMSE